MSVNLVHAGSSPHTRGLLGDRPLRGGHPLDHPRTRGVYRSTVSVNLVHAGSSPHTRGLLSVSGISQGSSRIIPAHAGFTCCSPGWRPGRTDHPRTRGVYAALVRRRLYPPGSSPHTRGLPYRYAPFRAI